MLLLIQTACKQPVEHDREVKIKQANECIASPLNYTTVPRDA